MTDDQRADQRRRTLKGGKIVINNGFSTIQCTVRNLSATGARLQVTSILGIPESFQLAMDDGQKFGCTIAWRKETELGVKFV